MPIAKEAKTHDGKLVWNEDESRTY